MTPHAAALPASRTTRAVAARRVATRRGRADGVARRLRDLLRTNIVGGVYPDGLLPGESELMLTQGASRAAVREALTMLREEGLVERVQGIGTFAVHESRYVSTMAELHGDVRDEGVIRRMRPDVLDRSVVPASDAIARKLDVALGEPVLRLEYLAFVDGEPIGLATNYVKFPEAEPLLTAPFESDWYALLDRVGLPLGGSEWLLSAANADAAVAGLLNLTPGAAVMLAEELIWDEDGRVYDFAICYIRTDRHVYLSRAGSFAMRDTSETIVDRDAPERAVPIPGLSALRSAWVCACDPAVAATVAGHLAELGYAPDRTRPEASPALTAARLVDRAEPEIAVLAAGPDSLGVAAATAAAIRADDALDGLPLLVALDAAALADAPAFAEADELVVGVASAAELRVRIARAWQRAGAAADGDTVTLDGLVLNVATHETTIDGAPVDLTHMEHRLLRFLLTHPRRVFAREALLERVWGYEHYGQTRTVDVHVRRLRAKLGDEYGARIETVRSVGYRLAR